MTFPQRRRRIVSAIFNDGAGDGVDQLLLLIRHDRDEGVGSSGVTSGRLEKSSARGSSMFSFWKKSNLSEERETN